MIIPSDFLEKGQTILKDIGITAFATGADVNPRTLLKAIDEGKCRDDIFLKIKKFIAEREAEVRRMLEQDEQ